MSELETFDIEKALSGEKVVNRLYPHSEYSGFHRMPGGTVVYEFRHHCSESWHIGQIYDGDPGAQFLDYMRIEK